MKMARLIPLKCTFCLECYNLQKRLLNMKTVNYRYLVQELFESSIIELLSMGDMVSTNWTVDFITLDC